MTDFIQFIDIGEGQFVNRDHISSVKDITELEGGKCIIFLIGGDRIYSDLTSCQVITLVNATPRKSPPIPKGESE